MKTEPRTQTGSLWSGDILCPPIVTECYQRLSQGVNPNCLCAAPILCGALCGRETKVDSFQAFSEGPAGTGPPG